MARTIRALLGVLALALAPPARAAVQVLMTVEGPRGPFTTKGDGAANAMTVAGAHVDFGPSVTATLTAPRPVVVTRAIDELSWQFLEAAASNEALRVVIVVVQTSPEAALPHRRVVTLSNARVIAIQTATDAAPGAASGLGRETISFTYDRIDVEDDGAKVYSSGG